MPQTKERKSEIRLSRLSAGLCSKCGKNQISPDHKTCQPCLDISNERARLRVAQRNANDLCIKCGNPAELNRSLCKVCKSQKSVIDKQRRDTRKQIGQCGKCTNPALPNRPYCEDHTKRLSDWQRELFKSRRQAGLCVACGEPSIGKCNKCLACYLKQIARINLGSVKFDKFIYDLFLAQHKKCFYCDVDLVMGDISQTNNAELDHKDPISRFPERAKDPTNVVWACFSCNRAKRDQTAVEFIAMCKQIAKKWNNTWPS